MDKTPYYECEHGVVYCGDCLEVMAGMEAGSVDAVVTDPPYGVNLGSHGAANEKRSGWLAKKGYDIYDDTPENFEIVVTPAIAKAIQVADRGLVFSAGTMMFLLPPPAAIGGVFLPAGCGRNKWGFQCLAHFCLYGKAPDLHLGAKPTAFTSTERADVSEHPCPKPLGWMKRCVLLVSREGETVLDPFLGSGTTAVACIRTGRKFIGIEISEEYCDIAVQRIKAELRAPSLWEAKPKEIANA